ncbi:MAG: DNA polymerase I [Deltaproteobacteria bacterium]|nr:DNA polymerase I [Deltaproteobacteria bacterium]
MSQPSQPGAPSKIVLVDGTNSLYRAFFAIPGLRAPGGFPTNAAYGFVNMLAKVLREEEPDAVIVVFDARGKTFRHELYAGYKAGRDAQPEDLSAQFPLVRELIEAHRIPIVEVPEFEADDVIATLVERAPAQAQVAIVSTDKDLMQLVSERVTLLDGVKDRRYGPAEVEERFGVAPERILDLRALVGDPSDNIPGVKGIGAKGAVKLLADWGDLEKLLEHAAEIKAKRARTALLERAEDARLSKRLSTLRTDVPLPLELADARRQEPDREKLRALYERLGFTRLLEALDEAPGAAAPAGGADVDVAILRELGELESVFEEISKLPCVPLLAVIDEAGPLAGEAVGLAVALDAARAVYLPIEGGIAFEELATRLEPLLGAGGSVAWSGCDSKQIQMLFGERGFELAVPHFDVEIAGQLLDSAGARALAALAAQTLGAKLRSWEELAGRGAKAKRAAELPLEELACWAGETICAVSSLRPPLARRLDADGLAELFEEVELPLTRVLARMERAGVRIDEGVLEELSREYQGQLERIEGEVHRLAGEEFLISSPKQLQRILFEKLRLPVVKKTKTGYSTDEDVLEQLSAQHELPERVLRYRRLAKLKNTYVDALPPLVNPRSGRIHPTFNQLGAATGRLSATHPNVQNIPIRTPEGVRIREAFVPAEGHLLLSADYSQVELRILAHYSQDESLIEAFQCGEDIHRRTAAEVAGIAPEQVSPEQRGRAKAVNFGIIYGSSAFGLAKQLGIAAAEAQETIDAYFERYRGVRRFLDRTIEEARERGYVSTHLGRRRHLPDLRSRNRSLRQAAERMAVNSVIQGTAADLIKKAMVAVDAALESEGPPARMILQVHDELVFEVPEAAQQALGERVRELMEGVLPLRVPLVVDVGVGRNWREAH